MGIIIESFGYNLRAGHHNGAQNCVYVYGNCLSRPLGITNDDFLNCSEDGPEGETFDGWYVFPEAESITLRGEVVKFDLSKENLERRGVVMAEDELTAADLFRSLLPEYREKFLATEEELRVRVPRDIPMILRLDEWHHPDIAGQEKPSENETFKSIAKVLVAADPSLYKLEKKPNNHWTNWPEGGTL
ncbi:hypothetical protein KA183_17175 [bacterium]|nr:hypothetical protein [bacterium]